MKRLFIIIAVFISVNCMAQQKEHIGRMFQKADSAFTITYLGDVDINKVKPFKEKSIMAFGETVVPTEFLSAMKEVETDTTKITITVEQCLLLYFNGYINGSLNYKAKGTFDFDRLFLEISKNRKSITSNKFLIGQ